MVLRLRPTSLCAIPGAISWVVMGLAVTAAWGQVAAPASEDSHGLKVAGVPVRPTPTPFSLDVSAGRISGLEYRAPEAMTAEDRSLAESAQGEIIRRAELQGLRMREDGMQRNEAFVPGDLTEALGI